MNRKTILKLGTSALLSIGLIGGAVTMVSAESHAANSDAAEARAFLAAPGSIAAAISAAEVHSGGKAISAEFEADGAEAGMYAVEIVMADGTMTDLLVNPANGSVTVTPADDEDRNETDEEGAENQGN